jgi:hypothetical protein
MKLATVLQIAGLVLVGVGVFTISVPVGIIVSGVLCVVVGVSLERADAE